MKRLFVYLGMVLIGSFLLQAQAAPSLVVGTSPDYPPFESLDGDKLVGYDVDVMNEAAGRAGLEVSWQQMSFDALIPAMNSGKIDVIASAMTPSEERKAFADFSDIYFDQVGAPLYFISPTVLSSEEDFRGKVIAVQLGTVQQFALDQLSKSYEFTVMPVANPLLAVQSVKSRHADIISMDESVAKPFLEQEPQWSAFSSQKVHLPSGFVFVVRKDTHREALKAINEALQEMRKDGTLKTLVARWKVDQVKN